MSEARLADTRFEMGRVIGQTFGVIGRNPVSVLLLCLFGTLAIQLLAYLVRLAFGGMDATAQLILINICNLVISLSVQAFLVGATVYIAVNDLSGQRVAFSAALATGFGLVLPLTVINIVTVLGLTVGFVLLIVPGVLLLLRWAVAVPVRVVEGPGIGAAFSRSAELTKGHRWAILALVVGYFVLFAAIGAVTILLNGGVQRTAQLQASLDPVALVIQVVTGTITVAISTSGMAAIYTELRRIKEGALPSQLASVFE